MDSSPYQILGGGPELTPIAQHVIQKCGGTAAMDSSPYLILGDPWQILGTAEATKFQPLAQ
jgi:hypothetical protein